MSSDEESKDKPDDPADSDEEDEDYVPGADPDEQGDDEEDKNDAGAEDDAPAASLSITKRKAVDDAFHELFGYRYGEIASSSAEKCRDKIPIKGNKRAFAFAKRRSAILASIFGKRACSKMMRHAERTASLARPKPGTAGGMIRLEKRVVAEVKRFAGQEIRVERVVMVPVMAGDDDVAMAALTTAEAAAAPSAASTQTAVGKPKGVDSLLDELSRPEKLSTISKTSADWDLFKSKNADAALKEQLEGRAAGNEAYLVKRDFLNRVDRRKFDLERAQRDGERARRGK